MSGGCGVVGRSMLKSRRLKLVKDGGSSCRQVPAGENEASYTAEAADKGRANTEPEVERPAIEQAARDAGAGGRVPGAEGSARTNQGRPPEVAGRCPRLGP